MDGLKRFEELLGEFKQVTEAVFLRDIADLARHRPEIVIDGISRSLHDDSLNIQLKYLLLKSTAELKFPELIPALKAFLQKETNTQLLFETVNGLAAMNAIPAYKIIADFLVKHHHTDLGAKIERRLKVLFSTNPLLYHFDIFYRNRGGTGAIEKSSDHLIRHLPDEYVKDLANALASRFNDIRRETLRILYQRPHSSLYSPLYYFFENHYQQADDELFLLMCRALTANACLSLARMQIFHKLKGWLPRLTGHRETVFAILLLKLSHSDIIPYVVGIFPRFDRHEKGLLLETLDPREYSHYRDFARLMLRHETQPELLDKITGIMVGANDFEHLFRLLDEEKGIRKTALLTRLLGHRPVGIAHYLPPYLTPSQDDEVLYMVLEYLLANAADSYFGLIKELFFSGVCPRVKGLILRHIHRFPLGDQKNFIESVFRDFGVVRAYLADFLVSLARVLNDRVFVEEAEEQLLNRLLILMEESPCEEVVHFLHFFEHYRIRRAEDARLIIDELHLMQNALLKCTNDPEPVHRIHAAIKQIERKMTGLK